MSPIHSSTPVRNVSKGVNDHGTLSRVVELEKKVKSLQEQMGILVQQIKDISTTESNKPEHKPDTNTCTNKPPLLKTPNVKPVNNLTTGNKILIIGSSILGSRYLKKNVQVESIKGATLFNALSGLHLPQFSDIIIQVEGNDGNQRRPLADIEYDIINIRDYKGCV
ncbi:hypothetical protein SNE40_021615 [Patella caerulea]|uniref:Uncharacterized protein n=1 Tax=Patella caerulea TaxID=87958 RepID=A0AAN8FZW3_PATCE